MCREHQNRGCTNQFWKPAETLSAVLKLGAPALDVSAVVAIIPTL